MSVYTHDAKESILHAPFAYTLKGNGVYTKSGSIHQLDVLRIHTCSPGAVCARTWCIHRRALWIHELGCLCINIRKKFRKRDYEGAMESRAALVASAPGGRTDERRVRTRPTSGLFLIPLAAPT